MKMTPFTDDLFIGRNYQQNMYPDCGLHSSYDRSLVSSTHGIHSPRWGQPQKSGVMPKENLNVLLVEGNGEKLAGELQERIQDEKVLGPQEMSAMASQRKTYQKELRAQLQEWEEQVALYRAKAESATDLAREEFYEITAALQRMQDETRMKLQELRSAGNKELSESQEIRGERRAPIEDQLLPQSLLLAGNEFSQD